MLSVCTLNLINEVWLLFSSYQNYPQLQSQLRKGKTQIAVCSRGAHLRHFTLGKITLKRGQTSPTSKKRFNCMTCGRNMCDAVEHKSRNPYVHPCRPGVCLCNAAWCVQLWFSTQVLGYHSHLYGKSCPFNFYGIYIYHTESWLQFWHTNGKYCCNLQYLTLWQSHYKATNFK